MILSINFYKNGDVPKVRFDLLIEHGERGWLHYPLPYIAELLTNDRRKMQTLRPQFGTQYFGSTSFFAQRYNIQYAFEIKSIAYSISDDPLVQLKFLNAITAYFENQIQNSADIEFIIINAGFIEPRIAAQVELPKLNYMRRLHLWFYKDIKNALIAQSTSHHLNITIEKLLEHAIDTNKLTACFYDELIKLRNTPTHRAIAASAFQNNVIKPPLPRSQVLNSLLNLAKCLFHDGKQNQLEKILAILRTETIKRLYVSCFDKKADDDMNFSYNHPEWSFLRHIKVTFDEHGIACMRDIQNNPGYKKYYANGRPNHAIFGKEMIHFWKTAGFPIQEDDDLHHEQRFTPDSSEKLKQAGFLTVPQIKRLMHARNIAGFFKHSIYQGSSEETKLDAYQALFPHIPVELKDRIMDMASEINHSINKEDLQIAKQANLPAPGRMRL